MITIVIADDHQMFRQGLKLLLEGDSRFRLLGEAASGSEALRIIRELSPDVALLDLAMPRPDGIEVAAALSGDNSATKCLILTMKEEMVSIRRALNAGARGYMLKESAFDRLAEAIVEVACGNLYLGDLQDNPQLFSSKAEEALTSREKAILQQVARGLTSRQIAAELCISPRTVETHRQKIMEKLGIRTAVALVGYAREQGLV